MFAEEDPEGWTGPRRLRRRVPHRRLFVLSTPAGTVKLTMIVINLIFDDQKRTLFSLGARGAPTRPPVLFLHWLDRLPLNAVQVLLDRCGVPKAGKRHLR
jgi:hypothetical protein